MADSRLDSQYSTTTAPTLINTTPVISERLLASLLPEDMREKYVSGEAKDTAPVIDLLNLGYSKLLGKGRLPEFPFVVRARYVSKLAERKITEAGGVIELVA
ncbi:hypothetical protein O1611_g9013 [Lasiodiplodia mahajangana]|uniref:Uncharacterized protein n=1 Tax=Lasiodiplodia mahajangana TaxID=1108764 RepID=A0ACC2JAS7_9PEZI|nr:hypothetical protein O1611_g9013 [Lasiodiplodia mahajangana]